MQLEDSNSAVSEETHLNLQISQPCYHFFLTFFGSRSVKTGLWRFAFPGAYKKAETKTIGLVFKVEESGSLKTPSGSY